MMASLAPFFAGVALLITGVGLCGTLAYTQGASRLIGSFLYRTSPRDPVILGVSVVLLVLVARAARIDAMTAIQHE